MALLTAKPDAWVGDAGFSVDFLVKFPLNGMSQVRMLVRKPGGEAHIYPFGAGAIAAATEGSTLSYVVEAGVLSVKGRYLFQPIAKDATVDLGFDPVELKVDDRIVANGWA